MPVIDYLDTANKLIYLAVGVRSYHPVTDIYHEVRELRRTNDALRWFQVPVTAAGNVPKGGGKATPRYALFHHGWRVVPEDTSHILEITGEQLTAEGGAGPECMDLTPLSATSKVIIQYEPPAAEVIEVGGGGSYPTAADIADAVWDEILAPHIAPGAAAEALALTTTLSATSASKLNEIYQLLGLDVAVEVKHGETYIRIPADGSLVNINVTKIGSTTTLQRL